MVQIPAPFNPATACIVTAASSGSRGVYGAIGSAGEWGLKRGCAVAYTDKGTGTGAHDLATDTVTCRRMRPATPPPAGSPTSRRSSPAPTSPPSTRPRRTVSRSSTRTRSRTRRRIGAGTRSTRSASRSTCLNEQLAPKFPDGQATVKFKADNTIVIASSVSNGGASAIAAAEQDTDGLIDGVVAGEPQPNAQPRRRRAPARRARRR